MARRKKEFGPLFVEYWDEQKRLYEVEARSAAQRAALALDDALLLPYSRDAETIIFGAIISHFERQESLWKTAHLRMAESDRQRAGVNASRKKADVAASIRKLPLDIPAATVAERLGCSERYVREVRRLMKAELDNLTSAK